MARRVQWRRGTSAQHETFTGALAEVTVDTDTGRLRVHDGSTPGGTRVNPFLSVAWFGARGDGTDQTAAIQAAADALEDGETLSFAPGGDYRVSAAITMPNIGWAVRGGGSTSTIIAPLAAATSVYVFDLDSLSGPRKIFTGIKFEGPATGVAGTAAAVRITNCNGILFDDCWFAGCNIGVRHVSGSFISGTNNAFEYCGWGIYADANMIESSWHNTTYYRNVGDIRLTGDNPTFSHIGSNHIATVTAGITLSDCHYAQFSDVSFCDDGSGYTPVLIQITGATGSKRNKISGVTAKSFGLRAISLEGSGTQFNDISGVIINGVPTGILVSSASRNTIRGLQLNDCTTRGIDVDSAPNNIISDFIIDDCDTGIRVNAASGNSFSEGAIINSGTADWSVANSTVLWVRGVEADFSAITIGTHVALLGSRVGNGRVEGFAAAAPGTIGYTFLVGDKIWKTDVAANGSPGWVCTTGGDPATWKAMPVVAA